MKKARGRPPKCPVDSLRTRIWFKAILLTSGFTSAYKVEMCVDGERVKKRDKDVARPRKWDSYEKGTVTPSDKPGKRNSVELAEAAFNGTAKWFRSPLWSILHGEKWSRNEYEKVLKTLGDDVRNILFEKSRLDQNDLWIKAIDDAVLFQVYSLGTFESFVAIVLLIQYSEVISSEKLRKDALFFYPHSQKFLRKIPELEPFCDEIFHHCDMVCKHWTFLSPSQRMDVVIFSKSRDETTN